MLSDQHKLMVYACSFEVKVREANVTLKFPCQLFVQWKTPSGKKSIASKHRVRIQNQTATFNESLYLETEVLLDQTTGSFLKKQSLLLLNLISSNRPEPKLIGRVTIDLASLTNGENPYKQMRKHALSYCSALGATLSFSVAVVEKRLTDKDPREVDKDSFSAKGHSRDRSSDSHHRVVEPRGHYKSRIADSKEPAPQRKLIRSSIANKDNEGNGFDHNQSAGSDITGTPNRHQYRFGSTGINNAVDIRNQRATSHHREVQRDYNLVEQLGGKSRQYIRPDRQKLRENHYQRQPQRRSQNQPHHHWQSQRPASNFNTSPISRINKQYAQINNQKRYQIGQSFGPRHQNSLDNQQQRSKHSEEFSRPHQNNFHARQNYLRQTHQHTATHNKYQGQLEKRQQRSVQSYLRQRQTVPQAKPFVASPLVASHQVQKLKRKWNLQKMTLENEIDKSKSSVTQLQLQNTHLRHKLHQVEIQTQQNKQKAYTQKRKTASITTTKDQLQMDNEQLKTNLQYELRKRQLLQDQLLRLNKVSEQETRKLNENMDSELQNFKETISTQLQSEKTRRRDLQVENAKLRRMTEDETGKHKISELIQELHSVRQTLQGKLDAEREKRRAAEDQVTQSKRKATQEQTKRQTAQDQVTQSKRKTTQEQTRRQAAEYQITQSKRNIAQEQTKRQAAEKGLQVIKEQQSGKQMQLEHLTRSIERLNEEKSQEASLRATVEQRESIARDQYQSKIQSLQSELEATKTHLIADLEQELDKKRALEEDIQRLRAENQTLHTERKQQHQKQLAAHLAEEILRRKQLQEKIEQLKFSLLQPQSVQPQSVPSDFGKSSVGQNHNQQLQSLRRMVDDLHYRLEEVNQIKTEADEELHTLRGVVQDHQALSNQLTKTNQRLQQKTQQVNHLLLETQQLKSLIDDNERQKYKLEKQLEAFQQVPLPTPPPPPQQLRHKQVMKESSTPTPRQSEMVSELKQSISVPIKLSESISGSEDQRQRIVQMYESGKFSNGSQSKIVLEQFLNEEENKRKQLLNIINSMRDEYETIVQENMGLKFELSQLKQVLQNLRQTQSRSEPVVIMQSCNHEEQMEQLEEHIAILENTLRQKEQQLQNATHNLERELASFHNTPKGNQFPSQISAIQETHNPTQGLTDKIQQLEKQLQKLHDQNIIANERFLDTDTKCLNFANQAQVLRNQLTALQLQKENLNSQCIDLINETGTLKAQQRSLQAQKRNQQETCSKLQQQLNTYQVQMSKLEETCSKLQQRMNILQVQKSHYEQTCVQLQEKMNTQWIQRCHFEKTCSIFQEKVKTLETEKQMFTPSQNISQNQRLKELLIEKQELIAQKDSLAQEKKYLISERDKAIEGQDSILAEIRQLQIRVEELVAENKTLLEDKQILFSQNWKREQDMEDQMQRIKKKDTEIRSLERQIHNLGQQVEELTEKIILVEGQKGLAEETFDSRNKQYTAINKDLNKRNEELKVVKAQLNDKDQELSLVTLQKERLSLYVDRLLVQTKRLQQENNQNTRLEQQNKEYNSTFNKKMISLEHDRTQLREMNETLMGSDRNLASKLQEAEQKNLRSLQQIQYLTCQISDLNTNLEKEIIKVQQCEEKILKYAEKDIKMRGDVVILEEESRKIFELMQFKEQNQEAYELMLQEKDTNIQIIKNNQNELVDALERAKQEIDSYVPQLQQAQLTINSLNERLASYQSKLSNSTSTHKQQSQRYQEIESRLTNLQKQLQIKNKAIQRMEEGAVFLQQMVEQKEKQYRQLLDDFTNLDIEKEQIVNKTKIEKQQLESLLAEQFRAKEEALLARLDITARQNNSLAEEIQAVRGERDEAARDGEGSNFQIKKLEGEISSKKQTISQLQESIRDKDNQIGTITYQKDNLTNKITDLQAKIIQHTYCAEQLRSDLNRIKSANTDLADQLTQAQIAITDLQKKAGEDNQFIRQLENKIKESQQTIVNLQKREVSDSEYIFELENLKEGVQSDSERVKQELMMDLRRVRTQLDDANKVIDRLNRDIVSLKTQKQDHILQNGRNDGKIQDKQVELEHMKGEIHMKNHEIQQLCNKNTLLEEETRLLQRIGQEKDNQLSDLNRERQILLSRIVELQASLGIAQEGISEQESRYSEIQAQLAIANHTIEQYHTKVISSNNQIAGRNTQLVKQNQALIQTINEQGQQIEILNAEIKQMKVETDQTNNELEDLRILGQRYQKLEKEQRYTAKQIIILTGLNEELRINAKNLEQKLKAADDAASAIKPLSLQHLPSDVDSMKNSNVDPSVHKKLTQELRSMQESMYELENYNLELAGQKRQLADQLNEANLEKEDMHNHVMRIEAKLSAVTQERELISKQRQKLQKRIEEITRKQSELQYDNKKLGQSRKTLENRLVGRGPVSSIQSQYDAKDGIIRDREDHIASLSIKIQKLQKQAERAQMLAYDNQQMMKDLERLEQELFSFNSLDNDKQMRIDQLQQENGRLRDSLEQMKLNIDHNENIISSQDQNIFQLNTIINNLNDKLDTKHRGAIYIASYPMGKQEYEGKKDRMTYHSSPDHVPLASREINEIRILQTRITQLTINLLKSQQYIEDLLKEIPSTTRSPQYTLQSDGVQNNKIKDLTVELEDHKNREVEQMNALLDLQLRLSEQIQQNDKLKRLLSQKKPNLDALRPENHSTSPAAAVYNNLFSLLEKRTKKDQVQSVFNLLIAKKVELQKRIDRKTEERGIIQQKARSISMEFQKLKSFILKGKLSHQDKSSLLSQVKPSQIALNQVVRLSESLTDATYSNSLME